MTLPRRTNTQQDQLNHQQSHHARAGPEGEPSCDAAGLSLAGDSDHASNWLKAARAFAIKRLPIAPNLFITASLMLKELVTALLCGFAIAAQMCAQEVVVAREASPNSSSRVAPVSKGRGSELETATEMKSQGREKKSAATTLTIEQMRMAGALAAERQKKQT